MSADVLRDHKIVFTTIGILALASGTWGVVSLSRNRKAAVPKEFTVAALNAEAQEPGKVFEQIHQAMGRTDLTDEQKHEIRENAHAVMEIQMDRRVDSYFAAKTDSERQALLDQQLEEMQSLRKEWEQRRAQRQQEGANLGAAPSQPGGGAGPVGTAGGTGPDGVPGAPPAGGPPAGFDRGRRGDHSGPPSREQRKMHTESRDPDRSARRMAYFTALQQRAGQRGIQLPGFMGRGGPGGPGGPR